MSQNELNHMVQEGIGEQYYYIYTADNCIVGKCGLADGKYRWILLADQNVFDDLNIFITR